MTDKFYKLTKISKDGFSFTTSRIDWIYARLEANICSQCMWTKKDLDTYIKENKVHQDEIDYLYEHVLPDDWQSKDTYDKVMWLLGTACGCEFNLSEYDSYHHYMIDKMEDVQYYFKQKQGKLL